MAKAKMTFEQWIKKVDEHLLKKVYMTHMDLPDCPYMRWYEYGFSPSSAAAKAIKNAKES